MFTAKEYTSQNQNKLAIHNRKYELDYLRFIAILMIFTFHYTCTYQLFDSPFYKHANGGWGCPGTSVFFILSGYLLRSKYKEINNLKNFYKKRFLSIFPTFYIAFIVCYLLFSIKSRNFLYGGNPLKLIFTILGIDNYMGFYGIYTYALVGEWFTAIIVIAYLLYPLLNYFFNKNKYITISCIAILYLLNSIIGIDPVIADASLFSGIFLFTVGMFLNDIQIKSELTKIILLVLIVFSLLITTIEIPSIIPKVIINNMLGINLFIILRYLFTFISRKPKFFKINNAAKFFSTISYCIYISHHFILNNLAPLFGPLLNTRLSHFINYLFQLIITVITSIALNFITQKTLQLFKNNRDVG